jgi:GNAT superfamily N-acetyltransferase
VRPIEASDQKDVEAFLERQRASPLAVGGWQEARPIGFPAFGLLGKLLGDIVAVVRLEVTGDALRVDDVIVASDLRRKWIGRVMMNEVEQLAVKMDRRRVVVEDARDAQEFFRRTGFEREHDKWIRVVS